MLLILALILILVIGFQDGSMATIFAGVVILSVSLLQSLKVGAKERKRSILLAEIVFIVYFIAAFIISRAYEGGNTFYVSDPSRYIDTFLYRTRFYYDLQYFADCYFKFSDTNALYNGYLLAVSVFANNNLGGATVFYLTLAQTLFGVLSINVLYRILAIYLPSKDAYKSTLLFATCSLFLLYSSLILRDIIIAYFFLLAIEIILKKFKIGNLLWLVVLLFVAWGIRLYSGLFMVSFIALYLYLKALNTRLKAIALPVFIVTVIAAGGVLLGSVILEQSMAEIDQYTEMTQTAEEASGGLISVLYRLPPGISQVAIAFYSQMAPFPPHMPLLVANSIPSLFIALDVIVYEVFWFFVFYTLLMSFVFMGTFKRLDTKELLLFGLAVVFILANTAHPDIRRMMPMYPVTYLIYCRCKQYYLPPKWLKNTKLVLGMGYVGLLLIYIFIKG